MSCDNFVHGDEVHLIRLIPQIPVPLNASGIVVDISRELHSVSVDFIEYGTFHGLDPLALRKLPRGFAKKIKSPETPKTPATVQ
jgi:hypothetical protein